MEPRRAQCSHCPCGKFFHCHLTLPMCKPRLSKAESLPQVSGNWVCTWFICFQSPCFLPLPCLMALMSLEAAWASFAGGHRALAGSPSLLQFPSTAPWLTCRPLDVGSFSIQVCCVGSGLPCQDKLHGKETSHQKQRVARLSGQVSQGIYLCSRPPSSVQDPPVNICQGICLGPLLALSFLIHRERGPALPRWSRSSISSEGDEFRPWRCCKSFKS
jgi:hypothetical protein